MDMISEQKRVQSPTSICSERNDAKLLDTKLKDILRFPPLLEAFQEFCQKALCSEVRSALTMNFNGKAELTQTNEHMPPKMNTTSIESLS